METFYSNELNAQMLIFLLKANGIKKIIISPGATNIAFAGSVQSDSYFELYSVVDERSAAYMACGMAAESGEPVVLSCTGATASRNYIPALTEAFYRKLPVLAVTSSQDFSRAYNLHPQYVDRSKQLADMVTLSVQVQNIKDATDLEDVNLKLNRALLQLKRHGGGPVHINLATAYSRDFSVKELPQFRVIRRYMPYEQLPEIPQNAKVLIYVGTHAPFSKELETAIDNFCAAYDAVVLVDHSSGYRGKYSVLSTIVAAQIGTNYDWLFNGNLLIHIGEQTGDYFTYGKLMNRMEVWRVSEDGEIRDTFKNLTNVFEMPETQFFNHYAALRPHIFPRTEQLKIFQKEVENLYKKIPELPFSNVWLAQHTMYQLPENCLITFGLSNSMRSWTFFRLKESIVSRSNTGTRGIDGALSTCIGMSLANKNRIHFAVLGDLAFFYDIGSLGSRHIQNNLRILLVNNGCGTEFHMNFHAGAMFGTDVDNYVAAGRHFGNKSSELVKHYAEDLGFEYLSASNKEEFLQNVDRFVTAENLPRPIIFEVFTYPNDESDAVYLMQHIAQKNILGLNFPPNAVFCGEKIFEEPAKKILGNYLNIEDENHQLNFAKIFHKANFLVAFTRMYPQLKNFLESNGLKEGTNFIDGRQFLNPRLPIPENISEKILPLVPNKKPQLGFGIMRMPRLEDGNFDLVESVKMVDEYMKSDFCYFDMAPGYCSGKSQDLVRELVVKRYPRESFLIASKMPYPINRYQNYIEIFVNSLQSCGVDYFDYYLLHAVSKETYQMHEKFGGFEFLKKMKALGKIRRIGFSFHDRPEVLDKILQNHPEVEFVQLQLNYLDWDSPTIQSRKLYETAKNHGKQILVMEPIKGGALANLEKIQGDISIDRNEFARLALNFVRSLDVDIILSGMSEFEHVKNNRQTFSEPLTISAEDNNKRLKILETLNKLKLIPCTSCKYCEQDCPKNIPISNIFSWFNAFSHTGSNDITFAGRFKNNYRRVTFERGKASDCIKCGNCEKRCPQKIKIRQHLAEAAKIFEQK